MLKECDVVYCLLLKTNQMSINKMSFSWLTKNETKWSRLQEYLTNDDKKICCQKI